MGCSSIQIPKKNLENQRKSFHNHESISSSNENSHKELIQKESNQMNNNKYTKELFQKESFPMNNNESNNELISVIFKITDKSFGYPKAWNEYNKKFGYPMACYNLDNFSTIEQKLYSESPDLKEEKILFIINGNRIDKSATLEQNKIKDNTIILLEILEKKIIKVYFTSDKPKIHYSISCYDTNLFSTIEQKFFNKFPQLKEKMFFFK